MTMYSRCPKCHRELDIAYIEGEGAGGECPACGFVAAYLFGAAKKGRSAAIPEAKPERRGNDGFGPVLTTVADVERQSVRWLWEGRLAAGRLTAVIGDPGAGKSWLACAVAAAITRGAALPGETAGSDPAGVLMLNGEDGIGDTLRPRLEDLGANLNRCHVLSGVRDLSGGERFPSLSDHLPDIERALTERGCKLLIVDPINSFLGATLDTHRDAALRAVLSPLAAMCERLGVASLFVMHLRKSGADRAIYRAGGSVAYTAAARVVLLAGADPETGERALVWLKGNLSAPPDSIGYEIGDSGFYWTGASPLTAADILAPDREAGERSALDEAIDFLRNALRDGPQPGRDIQREAAGLGISPATLRRARERLKVSWEQPRQEGKRGGASVLWSLQHIQDAHSETLSNLMPLVSESAEIGPVDEQPNPDAWKLLPGDDIIDPPPRSGSGRCRCGLALSVVAVGDRCGRCAANVVMAA